MKEKVTKAITILLTIIVVFTAMTVPFGATQKNTSNRFNVCFVLDSTNSLLNTDSDKLRFDATNLFLGLLANEGNYVGSVIFSDGVIRKNEVVPISGPSDKKVAESNIETDEQLGDTTIGAALDQAIDMLIASGNPDLPSVVILLSDGQSNKDDEDEMNSRSEALAKAKSNKIPVYTVALNADGEADLEVLEQIANATNGVYKEVKQADDLKDVFREFYNMIYSVGTITLVDTVVPESGHISVPFEVPYQGVEEVNIIISSESKLDNLILEKPNGKVMERDEVAAITTSAKRFSITKITEPVGGTWTISGDGAPGSYVKIDMIYNDSITVKTEYDAKEIYGLNDTVTVKGYVLQDGENLDFGYSNYTAKLVPDSGIGSVVDMKLSENSFEGVISFDQEGTFLYHMEVEGNGLKKSTDESEIVLNVGNRPPYVPDENKDIKKGFWVFPFITKEHTVDLAGIAIDPDEDDLIYSVSSSTFKPTTYEIRGDQLIIKDFHDLSKGICTIKATDPHGASAEFNVTISLKNFALWAMIVGGIILLIIIGLMILFLFRNKIAAFAGDIYVENIASRGRKTFPKNKGQIMLSSFSVGDAGFEPKAHFQATNKSFVYFKSKKTVYPEYGEPGKKVKISNRIPTKIFSDSQRTKGIIVTFESFLQK